MVKHGECGVLSGGLALQLLEEGQVSKVARFTLDEDLHAFLVISDSQDRNQIAIDPFFDICCPLEQYWTNKKLLRYGRALKGESWTPPDVRISTHEYFRAAVKEQLPYLKLQCLA